MDSPEEPEKGGNGGKNHLVIECAKEGSKLKKTKAKGKAKGKAKRPTKKR